MKPLIYQVQSACDYVKAAAAWLSGQTPPKHEDNEKTLEELRARIRKTVAFAESVSEAQYEGAEDRKISLSWAPGKILGGKDYLLQMTISERLLPHRDGLRGIAQRRCRRRQDGFSWNGKLRRRLMEKAIPFSGSSRADLPFSLRSRLSERFSQKHLM